MKAGGGRLFDQGGGGALACLHCIIKLYYKIISYGRLFHRRNKTGIGVIPRMGDMGTNVEMGGQTGFSVLKNFLGTYELEWTITCGWGLGQGVFYSFP